MKTLFITVSAVPKELYKKYFNLKWDRSNYASAFAKYGTLNGNTSTVNKNNSKYRILIPYSSLIPN